MKVDELKKQLSQYIPQTLVDDIVSEFIGIKIDVQTGTFGNSAPGKFVESIVQIVQNYENSSYEKQPKVDSYLKGLESRSSILDDDFRITLQRIARAQYTLRNKRNIAHKGEIAPNLYDLKYIYASAQWILSELVRKTVTNDKDLAGRLVEFIQIKVDSLVEEFGDIKIVHGEVTIEQEILILLHSNYPIYTLLKSIRGSLERRSRSAISNAIKKLWNNKDIHKENDSIKLTQTGFNRTVTLIKELSITKNC